ncbi:hypothetical protein SAMN05660649_03717 [Desulfotomaculum arcticum]|uniref:HepT-like domain-containing protein n=1 Tax=Desulfotruncus arcticus DSM 17038 TaxID=1121424 RepID=A0A1I2X463_9FIRM|nr:hypothetical protein [Desulfotruncus arcticus]SFH06731.1 hypothetical protein SAMN05660649_03717 [Desulfotomaculum arcticum] [Desulfotruncus arcticus DSM 17038]
MTPNLILLEVRVRKELFNLEKLVEELKTITRMRELKVNSMRVRACASILHDFYSGIEKIFINVAREIDQTVPKSEGWHRELLEQMTLDIPVKRPAVIGPELAMQIQQYLSFRHRFRNLYGYELEWGKMEGLTSNMESTLQQLKDSVEKFMEVLAQITE